MGRGWKWAVAVAAVALLAGAILLTLPGPETNEARFPNGRDVFLLQVRYGKIHDCALGSHWKRLLATWLPSNLVYRLKLPVLRQRASAEDVLSCWLEVKDGAGHSGGNFSAALVDQQGCESVCEKPWDSGWQSTNGHYYSFRFTSFPRRSDSFLLKVYGSIGDKLTNVQFTVRNPARRRYPNWKPEPFPITRQEGTNQFCITAFETDSGGTAPLGSQSTARTTLRFRLGEYHDYDWHVLRVRLRDATGNFISMYPNPRDLPGNEKQISFPGSLWADEPAWHVELEFSHDSWMTNGPREDIQMLTDLKMPGGGETNTLGTNLQLRHGKVTLVDLVGETSSTVENYLPHMPAFTPTQTVCSLATKLTPTTNHLRLDATDAYENPLRLNDYLHAVPPAKPTGPTNPMIVQQRPPAAQDTNIVRHYFLIPTGTKQMKLRVKVYKNIFVDFMARPTFATTNNSRLGL